MYNKIKDIKHDIGNLQKRRDHFDEKYETSRFEEMIMMDDKFNQHDHILKELLEEDRKRLEDEKKRKLQ